MSTFNGAASRSTVEEWIPGSIHYGRSGSPSTRMTLPALRTSGKPPLDFVAEKGMAIHTSRCLIALRDGPSNTLRFSGYARGSGLTDAA